MHTNAVLDSLDWAGPHLGSDPASIPLVINRLNQVLCAARAALPPEGWADLVGRCREHAVCRMLHEDPLTRRSFTKPRGYPGDAGLLDIIYQKDWRGVCAEPTSERGAAIFQHTIRCQAPAAVRHRRALLAGMIDEMSQRKPGAAMMSVACGHLRELRLSEAMRSGRVGRFVGLDQDDKSLDVVAKEWPGRVETVVGTVKALWGAGLRGERFDFIYSAGLYDYLDERFAQRLTARLFEMLLPGGRLLVANYHPSVNDVGYMETFMDWRLIYRDSAAMHRLAKSLPHGLVDSSQISSDRTGAVLYLQLERRA